MVREFGESSLLSVRIDAFERHRPQVGIKAQHEAGTPVPLCNRSSLRWALERLLTPHISDRMAGQSGARSGGKLGPLRGVAQVARRTGSGENDGKPAAKCSGDQ